MFFNKFASCSIPLFLYHYSLLCSHSRSLFLPSLPVMHSVNPTRNKPSYRERLILLLLYRQGRNILQCWLDLLFTHECSKFFKPVANRSCFQLRYLLRCRSFFPFSFFYLNNTFYFSNFNSRKRILIFAIYCRTKCCVTLYTGEQARPRSYQRDKGLKSSSKMF